MIVNYRKKEENNIIKSEWLYLLREREEGSVSERADSLGGILAPLAEERWFSFSPVRKPPAPPGIPNQVMTEWKKQQMAQQGHCWTAFAAVDR